MCVDVDGAFAERRRYQCRMMKCFCRSRIHLCLRSGRVLAANGFSEAEVVRLSSRFVAEEEGTATDNFVLILAESAGMVLLLPVCRLAGMTAVVVAGVDKC